MSVTNLPAPRFVQLAARSDFDVQVEKEVGYANQKHFDCLICLRQGADVPSV